MKSLALRRKDSQEQLLKTTEPSQPPDQTPPQPTPTSKPTHPGLRAQHITQSSQSLYSPIRQSQSTWQHSGHPSQPTQQITSPAALAHQQRQFELRKRVCLLCDMLRLVQRVTLVLMCQ